MENQARFDRLAAEWDSAPPRRELAAAVAAAIETSVPLHPAMRVMDFGTGTGLLALHLAPRVRELVATDVSPGMLEVLGAKLAAGGIGNVRPLRWDAERTDCPESGFDLVVSSMAMHHVEDTGELLARLRRTLAPGGWLALADLDTEDGSFHPDPTGVRQHGFDRDALRRRLEATGLTDVAIRDAHTMRRGAPGGERSYGIFLAVGRVPA